MLRYKITYEHVGFASCVVYGTIVFQFIPIPLPPITLLCTYKSPFSFSGLLIIDHSISRFSGAVIKCPNRSKLTGERACLGLQFPRAEYIMVEAGSKQLEKTESRAHSLYYKPEAEKTDWKKRSFRSQILPPETRCLHLHRTS